MTILTTIAFALFALGALVASVGWVRCGGPQAGLVALLALGALHQGVVLFAGAPAAWPPAGTEAAAQVAILLAAVAGCFAARAFRRTVQERNRAENLHWDSMEAVRALSELAARPGARFEEQLAAILARGSLRFDLETGLVWLVDAEAGGRIVARHDAESHPETIVPAELPDALVARLAQVAQTTRPLAILTDGRDGQPPVFFGTAIRIDGQPRGALAFVGRPSRVTRFTATDKDLLGLMAQWIATEVERRDRAAAAPPPTLAERALRPLRARRRGDLNALVRRAEPRLRRRVATDAALELDLAPSLPPIRPVRVAVPILIESLLEVATALAPSGRIRVETRAPAPGTAGALPFGADVTLSVVVEGDAVDAAALERAFHSPASSPDDAPHVLGLAQLEPLLRRSGGDLSVAVEPGHRATLTAFLPAAPTAADEDVDEDADDPPGPNGPDAPRAPGAIERQPAAGSAQST